MVAPLIAAAAGTLLRSAGTRALASEAAGSATAGRAAQFGGAALQRSAAAQTIQRQDRPGIGSAAVFGMMQPTLAKSASQQYSQVLQTNQFG